MHSQAYAIFDLWTVMPPPTQAGDGAGDVVHRRRARVMLSPRRARQGVSGQGRSQQMAVIVDARPLRPIALMQAKTELKALVKRTQECDAGVCTGAARVTRRATTTRSSPT